MKTAVTLGAVAVAIGALAVSTVSSPAQNQTFEVPESTLFACEGEIGIEVLNNVINAYEESGDRAAWDVANEASETPGIPCANVSPNGILYFKGEAFEGYEKFAGAECRRLTNDHCLAVQPVFTEDGSGEIDWEGYIITQRMDVDWVTPFPTAVSNDDRRLFDIVR